MQQEQLIQKQNMGKVEIDWSQFGSEVEYSKEWLGAQVTCELLCLSGEQQQSWTSSS